MGSLLLQAVGLKEWVVLVADSVVFGLAFVASYTCFFIWELGILVSCFWDGGGEGAEMLWCLGR